MLKIITNSKNNVVTIQGDVSIAAAGATYKNGFGIQLPFLASAVQSVTGQKFKNNYISLASNGVEAGQTKAVIIPFDSPDILIHNADNSDIVNTLNSKEKVQGTTASVLITLVAPIAQSALTVSTFNPFLISNQRRGYEIHLPGYVPTDKADLNLLTSGDDGSVPGLGRYYVSKQNWPWAIAFNDQFTYPLEYHKITDGYLHFATWASSGGTLYLDWDNNPAAGYRNTNNLYLK